MPEGFFKQSVLAAEKPPDELVPKCGACGLYKTCKTPKMEYSGTGKKEILIVAEAPGAEEDEKGTQLVGRSGQKLAATLDRLGINMRRDCWLTNAIICRPPENQTPDDNQLDYCRPNLTKTIKELSPKVIIPLGERALKSVLHGFWREDTRGISRWAGWRIPCRARNAWICPTWHPAYLLRSNDPALELWFGRHLSAAVKQERRPYDGEIPDLRSSIQIIVDPDHAAKRIRGMIALGDFPAAFDYETNMLKPDGKDSRIVCCSISWGEATIAYPWSGAAIEATREFIRSPAPKISSNMKFEDRWTRIHLGCRVKNWAWDTMLAAHILDNRPGISSIKFQALVRLGMPIYDQHIKPYFESKGTGIPNRIDEVDMDQLLMYCGLDSLLEYKVAQHQMKEMGYERLHHKGAENRIEADAGVARSIVE